MLKSINLKQKSKWFGFTTIELLVSIVVLGIIVAITTVSYIGITNKAVDATLKSDLSNAMQEIKLFYAENFRYPTAIDNCPNTDMDKLCIKATSDNIYEYEYDNFSSKKTFLLTIANNDSKFFIQENSTSPIAYSETVFPTTYTLTTAVSGTGGTVSSGGVFATGSTQTIIATPSIGYAFSGWIGSNGCIGASSHTIVMTTDKTCQASFIITPITQYTLTIVAGTGGTVNAGGTYDTGTVRTITATPSTYYSFTSWTGSTGCSGVASHTITMDANKTCTANFTPIPISAPTTPTVTANTVGSTTTFSWGAASCPGNTARYQYRYTITPSGYDSGLVATASTSVPFTTSTEGQTYTVATQAQCYNTATSSSWSTSGTGSYLRPISSGGTITYNSGSGSWTAPAGATSVTAYVWGAGGSGYGGCSDYGGGGGGAFATKTIAVTAGNSYSYSVGAAIGDQAGQNSWFINSSTVLAKGGSFPTSITGATGGQASLSVPTTGAYSGGNGGAGQSGNMYGGGGGGGAGSSGNGGAGSLTNGGSGGPGTYPGGAGGVGSPQSGEGGASPGGGGGSGDSYDCYGPGLGGSGKIILVW